MGDRENRIIEWLLQDSTILSIITAIGVIWGIIVPEAKIEAILVVAGIVFAFFQFMKDSPDAVGIVSWLLQPSTLKALVVSGCVLFNYILPEARLESIIAIGALFLSLIGILKDEFTRKLIFIKES